jgi:hypothetical protein
VIWILILLAIYLVLGFTSMKRGSAYRLAVASSFVLVAAMRLTL